MKKSFAIKKSTVFVLMSFAFVTLVAMLYVYKFIGMLDVGETEGFGFIGIIQSDAINYRNIYLNSNILVYIEAEVKNSVVPAMIWWLLDGDWYMATLLNLILLYFSTSYLKKIANHLQINVGNKIIFFIVFLPETLLYLIGVLKEIPTLLFFTALTYYYLKKRWAMFAISIVLLALFRYQFVFCIGLFIAGEKIFKSNNIRLMVVLFVLLASIYPILVVSVPGLGLENAKIYAELRNGLGLGQMIDDVQFNVYGVSFFATLIKFFQMIVEPWPTPHIFDGGHINVIALLYSISAIIMLPVWFRYFRYLIHVVRFPGVISKDERAVLGISFSFVIMVALNSFIHHRYLYPVIGLVLLVAFIPTVSRVNNKLLLATRA